MVFNIFLNCPCLINILVFTLTDLGELECFLVNLLYFFNPIFILELPTAPVEKAGFTIATSKLLMFALALGFNPVGIHLVKAFVSPPTLSIPNPILDALVFTPTVLFILNCISYSLTPLAKS